MARTAELILDDFSMMQFSRTSVTAALSCSRLPGFCRTLRMRPPTLVDVQVCVTKLGTAARSSRCAVGQKSELAKLTDFRLADFSKLRATTFRHSEVRPRDHWSQTARHRVSRKLQQAICIFQEIRLVKVMFFKKIRTFSSRELFKCRDSWIILRPQIFQVANFSSRGCPQNFQRSFSDHRFFKS